jgi:hypothetical protein
VSHNPFDELEPTEWVVSSLQVPSSSLLSSESSGSQDNWTFALDTTTGPSLFYTPDPFFCTAGIIDPNFSFLEDTYSSTWVAQGALRQQLATAPSTDPSHIMSFTETTTNYHAFPTIAEASMPELDFHIPFDSSHVSEPQSSLLPSKRNSATGPPDGLLLPTSSTSSSSTASPSSSSGAQSSQSKRRQTPPAEDDRTEKRRRNTLAAAKYRQKKLDKVDELEKQLRDVRDERDELRIRLAKRDAEVEILRRMLDSKGTSAGVDEC